MFCKKTEDDVPPLNTTKTNRAKEGALQHIQINMFQYAVKNLFYEVYQHLLQIIYGYTTLT